MTRPAPAPALLAFALLAGALPGCVEAEPPAPPAGLAVAGPSPMDVPVEAKGCEATLLAAFVEKARTDAFLPPGFRPRDPRDFLGIPATTGEAFAVAVALECREGRLPAGTATPFSSSFSGVFVEHPVVNGTMDAAFDFYELEHFAPRGPLADVLAEGPWASKDASVSAAVTAYGGQAFLAEASVGDQSGPVYSISGAAAAPFRPIGSAVTRFWRQGPDGIGSLDYELDLSQVRFGPGMCRLRSDSGMARLTGHYDCPPAVAAVATFPAFDLGMRIRFLPGVQAG